MPELFLELMSEEIPARMQARAGEDLKRLVTAGLVEAGLTHESAGVFVGPRRLALVVEGLPAATEDRREERKGPRAGAPEKAIAGFARSAGVAPEALELRHDGKSEAYFAVMERPGRPTGEVVAEFMPDLIRGFPWPKSMRWGDGALRWVRPLHSIVASFAADGDEAELVAFEVDGIASGWETRGHRVHGPGAISVRRFDDYRSALRAARVVIDREERKEIIAHDAREVAFARGLTLIEDPGLLEEVAGLVEWPVALIGEIDPQFHDLPDEVLATSMRAHQKFFMARGADGAPSHFVAIANLEAEDGGAAIVAGNERVLRARLADARFFWDEDRKRPLAERLGDLNAVTFHAKLGTQAERVARIAELAETIARATGADAAAVARAARLAKCDLTTEMVGEFPELQGLIGRYYAGEDGEAAEVAAAIEEHYWPKGEGAPVARAPVSVALALADKIDMLTGFWAIDEKPTGSKDPYALRRAALGVIRTVLDNGLRLNLAPIFEAARAGVGEDLLGFFAERLKVHLRGEGVRHDVISAVFALKGGRDDLVQLTARARAAQAFLETAEGADLLTAYGRAANILRIEEKKDGRAYREAPAPALFAQDEERALAEAIDRASAAAARAAQDEDFTAAMAALADLREPVDGFFEAVTVNAEDADLRANRLRALNAIRASMDALADFSKIEG